MQNMTPEEQRIAIAEFCGFTDCKEMVGGLYGYRDKDKYKYQHAVPDYLNDLNAMHEAEMRLTAEDHGRFADILFEIAFALGQGAKPYISATAAHRAQALLRALGLWRE